MIRLKDFVRASIFGFITFYLSISSGVASQLSYGWTRSMNGALVEIGQYITTDSSGNIYITGTFEDSIDFGADFGTSDIKSSAGNADIFVTRINSNGTYGWTRRIGWTFNDYIGDITTDISGNVYITGNFLGVVDFGADFGTSDIKSSAGDFDIFVTRINSSGTYGWTRRIGGTSGDSGNGILADSSGDIYITGGFQGNVNFGADFAATDNKSSSGEGDIFITRINTNGAYGWTKKMGGVLADYGIDISIDPSGNIYVMGEFQDNVDFGADFGTTDARASAGGFDIFITKINPNGTYGWARRIGGTVDDISHCITTDPSGNVYITGYFEGTVDFGADFAATDNKSSSGERDIFITRINANGGYGWTRRIGGTDDDYGKGITTDPSGNVYITGYFEGTVDFGADFGTTEIKEPMVGYYIGPGDVFITNIRADGSYGWTRRIGGGSDDVGFDIATDLSGNVYVTGYYGQEVLFDGVDFGADFGIYDIKPAATAADIFVTKLKAQLPVFNGHDFNGNGSSDISVFRPSNCKWYLKGIGSYVWGTKDDIPVNGDYSGDGKTDVAVWRPSNGRWYLKDIGGAIWGTAGDIPVPGNYDGDIDGKTEIAVWRPSNGKWYIQGIGGYIWGTEGDIPVPGDYNGDGKTEIAVWRPSNGRWYIMGLTGSAWGASGDIPVPADYNGDGTTDIAVWRPSNGKWYILGIPGSVWGKAGDIPAPGDYNGDGITNIAIWRPSNGRWYIKGLTGYLWGMLGDIPLVR